MFGWRDDGYKDVACCVFINRVLGIGYPDMCDECVCEHYNFGVLEAPGTDISYVLAMVSAITKAVLLQKSIDVRLLELLQLAVDDKPHASLL